MSICQYCFRENPDANKFCNKCGVELAAREHPPTSPQVNTLPPTNAVTLVREPAAPPRTPEAGAETPGPPDTGSMPETSGRSNTKENESAAFVPAPKKTGQNRLILAFAGAFGGGILFTAVFAGVLWSLVSGSKPQASAEPAGSTDSSTGPAVPAGMVYVPGGTFLMGSNTGDKYSRPAHQVTVTAFFIDITEVSNEEYAKFVESMNHRAPPHWPGRSFPTGTARLPVTGVDWDDANSFAEWSGKRLPTEAEWEFAAKGTDGRIYPWGHVWDPTLANAGNRSNGVREVGEGGKSPYGLFDVSGNAWEWTSSDAGAYPGGVDFNPELKDPKIIRSGFWGSDLNVATTTGRRAYGARTEKDGYSNAGFRCVKDIAGKANENITGFSIPTERPEF